MSTRFKTIDNLGIDQSIRYAEDQEFLDEKFLKYAPIHTQTEVDVSIPSYWDQYELLFQTKKRHQSWAEFFIPPFYNEQKKRLFTHLILPFLGSRDNYEILKRKIKERINRDKLRYEEEKKKRFQQGLEYDWEEELNRDAAEKESKTLVSLIELINFLDKILEEINSRRNQYQKG